MNLLSIDEVAAHLNISKASVRNWQKQGYLEPIHNNRYSPKDVDKLKEEINRGDINRLSKRANKSSSKARFIPTEYIDCKESVKDIQVIIDFILINNIKPEQALFLLSVNLLADYGDIDRGEMYEALAFDNPSLFKRSEVYNELKVWYESVSTRRITEDNKYCKFLLEVKLPNHRDVLGIIYQSIIREGKKSSLGSYYTPRSLVDSMINDNLVVGGKVLDPCCGTGQFLLKMAESIDNPVNIWGGDIDGIAVRITRINLFLFYSELNFKPNVLHTNTLLEWEEDGFDLVATNPPWGAKISPKIIKALKKIYPEVESKESFSFFIALALRILKKDGAYSFVLPESILYVKNHSDIRAKLLNRSSVKYIYSGGRMFKKVFSSVIRMDGVNAIPKLDSLTKISLPEKTFEVNQDRFRINDNFIMDIGCSNEDQRIIDHAYGIPHYTLKEKASWALGVVTGNNSLHIKPEKEEFMEPIYKGKDIAPLKLKEPSNFIYFRPEVYQQCANEDFYRAKEKLIYKFISKDLVFAYDNSGSLTINSANILIPEIENYPIKVIGAFLNSSIFQFIYKKKYNALKVLRGDIESLPFPKLKDSQLKDFTFLIESFLRGDSDFSELDDFVFSLFNLSDTAKDHVLGFLSN